MEAGLARGDVASMRIANGLRCIRCENAFGLDHHARGCPRCEAEGVAANLTVRYNHPARASRATVRGTTDSMWRFDALLHAPAAAAVTLGEGGTPLVPVPGLGLGRVYLKDESRNPTGSFKDRLASAAVTMARRLGARVIASSSSGNAGAATAAYAARAGLPCVIFTVQDAAGPMMAQMESYGAMLITVPTSADRWRLMSACVTRFGWYPTTVYYGPAVGSNPFGIEGYKTIAYEIAEALDWRAPDWCVLPVCYGDSLYGMWKGFADLIELGWIDRMPRFVAAEVSGSLGDAMARGLTMPEPKPRDTPSVATSIGAIQGTVQALVALRASDGMAYFASDAEIQAWHTRLARTEGVYAELSAVATLPAIDALRAADTIKEGDVVVALLTASGLKDSPRAAGPAAPLVAGEVDDVIAALMERYDFDTE